MGQLQATESPPEKREWVERIGYEILGNLGDDTSLTTYTDRPVADAVREQNGEAGSADNRIWVPNIRYHIVSVGVDRSINTYTDEPPTGCEKQAPQTETLVQLK